ncbi:MAG: hypothetical protein ACLP50_10575 [Solirubrobacteraceae bacterium]
MRQRRVQTTSRSEQVACRVKTPELVEREPGRVEHDRLTRFDLEGFNGGVGNRHPEPGCAIRRPARSDSAPEVEQNQLGVVAAILILQLRGGDEERPVALNVASVKKGLRLGAQAYS